MSLIRAGVIGAGVFGGYHANKYADQPQLRLAAIYDVRLDAAQTQAKKHGAKAFDHLPAFLAEIDIVTIASPADTHFEMGMACLNAGKHILIEKPIAASAAHGKALVDLAAEKNLVLAVDHQERAVAEAMGLLDVDATPTHIEAVRFNTWSPRGSDVSVTLDLMSHDLDLVCALMGEVNVTHIEARSQIVKSKQIDDIEARLTFDNGSTANLRASRIKEERERWMEINYPKGRLKVDFLTREFTDKTPFELNADFAQTDRGQDPLGYSVARFIGAVRDRKRPPLVTGADGLRALELAKAIDKAAG